MRFSQTPRPSANRYNTVTFRLFLQKGSISEFLFLLFFSNANRAVENSSKRQRLSKEYCQWIRTKDFPLI